MNNSTIHECLLRRSLRSRRRPSSRQFCRHMMFSTVKVTWCSNVRFETFVKVFTIVKVFTRSSDPSIQPSQMGKGKKRAAPAVAARQVQLERLPC